VVPYSLTRTKQFRMKGYLKAIKLNLEKRTLTKKILAGYSGVIDDELLDIADDVSSRSGAKSLIPSPKAGRRPSTLPRATIPKLATSRSTRFLTIASSASWTRAVYRGGGIEIDILGPGSFPRSACESCRFLPAADNYVYHRLPHPFHSF
jgi:hypothetical protein